jgi:hypothetical protein
MAQIKDRWPFMTVRLSLLDGGCWRCCCLASSCSNPWACRFAWWRLALVLLAVAARGHRISTREVLLHAPWQIVIFSLGMYLVVYGLRNAGLTAYLTAALDWCAQYGVWARPWAPAS